MITPNANIANFDAQTLNTSVEITHDEDYVFVRFHGDSSLEQYAFQNRRHRGRRDGMQYVAAMMQDASCILSADSFKRLLIDNGFAKVQ